MSNINIQRAIENIRSTTTVFTPIVETVVNAIEAIELAGVSDGLVRIKVKRSGQGEIDASESKIQDLQVIDIYPTRTDNQSVEYEDHNLWILDERLTFTRYLASDLPIEGGTTQRPDIIAFDRRVAFHSENETSNPVTIFEFKRPHRDDFVYPSSKEDPIQQIIRYVNGIRAGKFLTPKGREIHISLTTPFYGYAVCDLTPKVKQWLHDEKNFTPMPDNMGWFHWYANINLYIEVLSWDKMLRDAEMRNRVFFHKLGI